MDPEEVFADASGTYNAYLHIPFCEQYCTFCHFFKEINSQDSRVERYVRTLESEIDLVVGATGGEATVETVYFGGGTPSYLSASQLQRVFDKLWSGLQRTDHGGDLELHPGVVRQPDYEDRLDTIAGNGINRFVFGIQSMNDVVLKKLNRGHGREEVFRLLDLLEARNVDNLSVDLIFGLPYQTTQNWYETITELLDRGVEKYNIFPLFFKRSDPITKQYQREPEIFPDEQTRLVMHYMTERLLLPKGFNRGPLFYYAKSEHHSRQQESKFADIERVNLMPFGVSGFGYIGGTQFYNYCNMERHQASIAAGVPPIWRGWTLSPEERVRRTIMFSLRAHRLRRRAAHADLRLRCRGALRRRVPLPGERRPDRPHRHGDRADRPRRRARRRDRAALRQPGRDRSRDGDERLDRQPGARSAGSLRLLAAAADRRARRHPDRHGVRLPGRISGPNPYHAYIHLDDLQEIWAPRGQWRWERPLRAACAALDLTFELAERSSRDERVEGRGDRRAAQLIEAANLQVALMRRLLLRWPDVPGDLRPALAPRQRLRARRWARLVEIVDRPLLGVEDLIFRTVHEIMESWFVVLAAVLVEAHEAAEAEEWAGAGEVVDDAIAIFAILTHVIHSLDFMVMRDYHPVRVALRGLPAERSRRRLTRCRRWRAS